MTKGIAIKDLQNAFLAINVEDGGKAIAPPSKTSTFIQLSLLESY